MPNRLSSKVDLAMILVATLVMAIVLLTTNLMAGISALILWLCMVLFARERSRQRDKAFSNYCSNIIGNVDDFQNYAVDTLPIMILVVDKDGRIHWTNKEVKRHLDMTPEIGTPLTSGDGAIWPELNLDIIWGQQGETVFIHDDVHYKVSYRPIATLEERCGLMSLYVVDNSPFEILKRIHTNSRTALLYIQIDNYDDVLQGLTDKEKNWLTFETNKIVDSWVLHHEGFMRKVSDDLYIAIMERRNLDDAISEKFAILDSVHTLVNTTRKLPVTLSIGIAQSDKQSFYELGRQAQSMLDLALGRGGDQAALLCEGKTSFYGGTTKAVEKHTRVRARVIANSIRQLMQDADEIFIMGHHNEDFDAFGAALGISRMARLLGKPVHIILSDHNVGISKLLEALDEKEEYRDMFLPYNEQLNITAQKPLLFVVDTFIPHMTAAPYMLDRIHQVVVIDHHRRSENFIKNTKLTYLEPATSSTCELVTELLMYFGDDTTIPRMEATALYSGIVVDTKNFAVQVGVRTFDAAAYLRRCGADPVAIRQLFRTDYATEQAKAKAKASSSMQKNGLIITTCPDIMPNIQVVAAQVADALLRIEDVRASIVVFQLSTDTVGVSARSNGEINVQVIMEHFGGGGHQNVAGTQIKNQELQQIYDDVLEYTNNVIEEYDQHESNITEGR